MSLNKIPLDETTNAGDASPPGGNLVIVNETSTRPLVKSAVEPELLVN